MTDDFLTNKIKRMIEQMEIANIQNEINSAHLQQELASRFRLSKSEMGDILANMMEQDIIRKENKYKIRLRP